MTTTARAQHTHDSQHIFNQPAQQHRAMVRLVTAVQELSLARDLTTVMQIVRRAARQLAAADGATFVLRENDQCYYADEDAISPLWKGLRFPMQMCISGWAMLNRRAAVIPDIYHDPRVPLDAYRPTFVKSLVMVPIRTEAPIGAIGAYWATPHQASAEEVQILQALADSTSIAIENVRLYAELEQRVQDRTRQLEAANQDLEAFAYSVAHDLRSPLSQLHAYQQLLVEDYAPRLDADGATYLERIGSASQRMSGLIDGMLRLSRMARVEVQSTPVNLSAFAQQIAAELRCTAPERHVTFTIAESITAAGDAELLHIALENLLSNAWKYTSTKAQAQIAFGALETTSDSPIYYVRDNGVGFAMDEADTIFSPFQRLQAHAAFPGSGVGLATVQRIVQKHGGRLWAEAAVEQGATFYFTLNELADRKDILSYA